MKNLNSFECSIVSGGNEEEYLTTHRGNMYFDLTSDIIGPLMPVSVSVSEDKCGKMGMPGLTYHCDESGEVVVCDCF